MKRAALALWLAGGLCESAAADEASRMMILDQLQAQFSQCVAYYTLQQGCVGGGEPGRRLAAVTKRADALAGAIAMSPADAALRLQLNIAAAESLMPEGCGGLAVLESRFAYECDPPSGGRE
jgi:hypothetical protein